MTPEERSSIENGIWLCSKCAKLIDSDEIKYSINILHKQKVAHEELISKSMFISEDFNKESVEVIPESIYSQDSLKTNNLIANINDQDYFKVTAADLIRTDFRKDKAHILLEHQDVAFKKQNLRLSEFWSNYVDVRWNDVPRTWRAVIADLPIIARDIKSDSLNDLAELAKKYHPYISRKLHQKYLKEAKPILIGILADVQAFLQDSSSVGGLPLAIMDYPPPTWKDWLPWLWNAEKSWKIGDSLVHGCWTFAVPATVINSKIEIKNTWAGILFDIISRLPNPDKQKGKLNKNLDFSTILYIWCVTAPQDFKPSLLEIIRHPVNTTDNTLAGIYKSNKEEYYSNIHIV
jgi:hypothetical protein